ncbi:acyl dehydratase [Ramlibacter sp.]|uniref:acyl dehydratase n=1 Tax=Ramlibacter sp. TaxID=1917967 RepID=UPI003D139927
MERLNQGLYFEDFTVGRRFRSIGRTLTEADLCAFVNLTRMTEGMFTDHTSEEFKLLGGQAVPGALCYTFAEGLCIVPTLEYTGIAFLNMELDMKSPTYVGDTIRVEMEVIEARLARNKPGRGLVRTRNNVVKQDGTVSLVYTPLRLVQCRAAAHPH